MPKTPGKMHMYDIVKIDTMVFEIVGLFQTGNDPGGGGGALKAPPPHYDLENYCVNLHHIINVHFTRCFRHLPIGIFQKFAILTTLQGFQNKKVAKIVVKIIFLLFCLK